MKKVSIIISSLIFMSVILCGCGTDSFTVNVVCESEDVYMIFYSTYLDDELCGIGGMADYDKNPLTKESKLKRTFSKAYFDGRDDVSSFSMDLSPYGRDDTSEAGTTNQVYIAARYGGEYTIVLSGNRRNGFTAKFVESK